MTGSRTIAYLHEPSGDYAGTPTDTTYKIPGKEIQVQDLTLRNALMRMGYPDDPQTIESLAMNFEGAIALSFVATTPWYLDSVYGSAPSQSGSGPYTYTWSFPSGPGSDWRVDSSRWFFGLDHENGVTEREIKGAVFGQAQYDISVGNEVRVTLTGFYGDETHNTSVTPGSLSGKDADPMVFHGGSIEIPDSTTLVKPQSGTLTISTGARAQRGWQRKPLDAVLGGVETSLQFQKILLGSSQLTLAYGNSSAPTTGDVDGAADGNLAFTTGATADLTHNFTRVTPDEYGWDNIADRDADVLENITYNVDEVETVATSDEASAL